MHRSVPVVAGIPTTARLSPGGAEEAALSRRKVPLEHSAAPRTRFHFLGGYSAAPRTRFHFLGGCSAAPRTRFHFFWGTARLPGPVFTFWAAAERPRSRFHLFGEHGESPRTRFHFFSAVRSGPGSGLGSRRVCALRPGDTSWIRRTVA